jgi:hypothetical protein
MEVEFAFQVQSIDVDSNPQLFAEHGDKVPVIALEGRPRMWGRINVTLLRRLLQAECPKRQLA